jgi:hypothetical protein
VETVPTEKIKLADRMELMGMKSSPHVMDPRAMETPMTTATAWIVELTLFKPDALEAPQWKEGETVS